MATNKGSGFTLQREKNRAVATERGQIRGSWIRASAWRIRKTPPPPLRGKEKGDSDEKA